MATQIFTNAHVITPNQNFLGSVVVENDLIVEVIKNKKFSEGIDLDGQFLIPGIIDIRNCGVSAAFDLEPIAGKPGLRGMQILESCIEHGILVRITSDTIAMGPPFVASSEEVQSLVEIFSKVVKKAF